MAIRRTKTTLDGQRYSQSKQDSLEASQLPRTCGHRTILNHWEGNAPNRYLAVSRVTSGGDWQPMVADLSKESDQSFKPYISPEIGQPRKAVSVPG